MLFQCWVSVANGGPALNNVGALRRVTSMTIHKLDIKRTNTGPRPNGGSIMGQRRRGWSNIDPTPGYYDVHWDVEVSIQRVFIKKINQINKSIL